MRLSQSNVILFCILAAFLVFITLRGELPKYLATIFSTVDSGSGASGGSGGAAATGGDVAAGIGEAVSDPIGAATGAVRRGLGIGNGILPNLSNIGSSLSGLLGGIF